MIFAKIGFHRAMPLYFLEFVTNGAFSRFMPLSDFYKSWISWICAIRLFHRQGNIRSCDIKYLASRREYEAIYEEKSGRSKVTASEKGGFASKTAFLLRWRSASVSGLNVTGSSEVENVTKPNGTRF